MQVVCDSLMAVDHMYRNQCGEAKGISSKGLLMSVPVHRTG